MDEYLKNSGYRSLLNADILSGIGDSLYNIVFIVYASSVPNKKLAVSLASMATLIPALLSALTGAYADQVHSKFKVMVFTRLFQGGLFLLLSFLIGLPKTFVLFIALLLINIVSDSIGNFGNGLSLPLLQHLVPSNGLDAAMGLYSASNTTIQLIFQSLGAAMIVALNYNYPLFGGINAATFVLAAIILVSSRKFLRSAERKIVPAEGNQTHTTTTHGKIKAALTSLLSSKHLFGPIIFAVLINFSGASMEALINISLLNYHNLYLFNYGDTIALLNIVLSVGTILGGFLMNDFLKKTKLFSLLAWCTLAMFGLGLGFLWHRSLNVIILALFVAGYLAGKINPRLSALILKTVPTKKLATTEGLFQMLVLLAAPIGQVVFLGLANLASTWVSWLLFAAIALVLVIANLASQKVQG